jgi:hypothetical protein
MAGDWERDAPWRKQMAAKAAAKVVFETTGGVN